MSSSNIPACGQAGPLPRGQVPAHRAQKRRQRGHRVHERHSGRRCATRCPGVRPVAGTSGLAAVGGDLHDAPAAVRPQVRPCGARRGEGEGRTVPRADPGRWAVTAVPCGGRGRGRGAGAGAARGQAYDVLILDRDLPVVQGDEVCRGLVAAGSSCRILMLPAARAVDATVAGSRVAPTTIRSTDRARPRIPGARPCPHSPRHSGVEGGAGALSDTGGAGAGQRIGGQSTGCCPATSRVSAVIAAACGIGG